VGFFISEIEHCSLKEEDYESKATYIITACLSSVECGGIQYPPYRLDGLSTLSYHGKLSVLVFTAFQKFVFGKLVKKHTARISAYQEERHFFLKFFDKKAFVIMAVMMTGGIGLRAGGLVPERFIAVFYTGLGASLMLAGLLFGRNYGRTVFSAAKVQDKTARKGE